MRIDDWSNESVAIGGESYLNRVLVERHHRVDDGPADHHLIVKTNKKLLKNRSIVTS